MIVDTSAIIAILRDEPEAKAFAEAIAGAARRRVSAATYLEAAAVIDSSADPVASRRFDDLFQEAEFVIESVTAEQARVARDAYRDFGKGRHRAGLNFGDCFVYALARVLGEPVLAKGNDFRHTDLQRIEI